MKYRKKLLSIFENFRPGTMNKSMLCPHLIKYFWFSKQASCLHTAGKCLLKNIFKQSSCKGFVTYRLELHFGRFIYIAHTWVLKSCLLFILNFPITSLFIPTTTRRSQRGHSRNNVFLYLLSQLRSWSQSSFPSMNNPSVLVLFNL